MIIARVFASLLLSLSCLLGSEQVPESIQRGEWKYLASGADMSLAVTASYLRQRSSESMLEVFLSGVGRRLVCVQFENGEAQAMTRDSWSEHVRSKATTLDDAIYWIHGESLRDRGYAEFESTPTKDQEAWCRGLVDRWLVPLPEGFVQAGPGGGHIATWDHWAWGNSSRIRVTRRGIPKKGSGGPIERVYWFDRPMTSDAMLIEVASENEYLRFRRDLGGTVAMMRVVDPDERIQVSWPSGQFLVHLNMPKEMYHTTAKAYLERYPSSWPDKIDYDPKRLMLQVLDEAIVEMTKHVDGPLEFLRYSFKTYPFDDACRRAWNILPDNDLDRQHKDAINAIHENWAKAPSDKIKLSEYHDAMLAYRRDLIAKITAERERIAKEGVERKEK